LIPLDLFEMLDMDEDEDPFLREGRCKLTELFLRALTDDDLLLLIFLSVAFFRCLYDDLILESMTS